MSPTPPPLPPPPVDAATIPWVMNEFYGKNWVLTVQLLVFGGMAAFGLALGPLFLLGVMKDAYDEPSPDAGVALTLTGLVLAPIAAVMAYGLRARRRPII